MQEQLGTVPSGFLRNKIDQKQQLSLSVHLKKNDLLQLLLTPIFGLVLTVQRKSLDSYGSARLLIPVDGSTILHQIRLNKEVPSASSESM